MVTFLAKGSVRRHLSYHVPMSGAGPLQFCFRVESLPDRYPGVDIEAVFQDVVRMYIDRRSLSEMIQLPYPFDLIVEVRDLLVQAFGRGEDEEGGAGVPAKLGPTPPRWGAARIDLPN